MRVTRASWMFFAFSFGCDPLFGPAESPCAPLCAYVAECGKFCDPEEGETCDEARNYAEGLARCRDACEPGIVEREGCRAAAAEYSTCVEGRLCGAPEGLCATASMRYEELCVQAPGALLCPLFCAELKTGCLPYARFGFRGAGCEETCRTGAGVSACREAHYALGECLPARGYACQPLDAACEAEALAVESDCEPWAAVEPDPGEVSFCEGVAGAECRCGLWGDDPGCASRAAERCLFTLGEGAACRVATEAFVACMEGLQTCDRDALRAQCLDTWDAWSFACRP